MKVFYANYILMAKTPVHTTLLKYIFSDNLIGYSSLLMWPQLGDPSIKELLNELALQKQFPLQSSSQTLQNISQWAYSDALARKNNVSLLAGADKINNHYLISDLCALEELPRGASVYKVKYQNSKSWIEKALLLDAKLRIDFNAKFSESEFLAFYSQNSELFRKVEYVEDACDFSVESWSNIKKSTSLKLALDFYLEKHLFEDNVEKVVDVVVIKPQTDPVDKVMSWIQAHNKNYTFTSYMDHPVGQAHACAVALQHLSTNLLTCGLASENVYEPNEFSKKINFKNSLSFDCGIGFTPELERLDWEPLHAD